MQSQGHAGAKIRASDSFGCIIMVGDREQSYAAACCQHYRILPLIALMLLTATVIAIGCAGILLREDWVHPEISGVVRDSATSAPMPGVIVTVIDSDYYATEVRTGTDGSFHIPPTRAWRFGHRETYITRLRIQTPGYYAERAETWHGFEEVQPKRAAPERYLEVALERKEVELAGIDRDTIFFFIRGWEPPNRDNNFRKAR